MVWRTSLTMARIRLGRTPSRLAFGLEQRGLAQLAFWAWGMGLDATIHYLNRLRLQESAGGDLVENIARASVLVGPALIVTTLVLAGDLLIPAEHNERKRLQRHGRLLSLRPANELTSVWLQGAELMARS